MGEGIRNAKVVSLLKKPGDPSPDTNYAKSKRTGCLSQFNHDRRVMGEWKTKVGDTVDIGQELGTLFHGRASLSIQFEQAAEVSADRNLRADTFAAQPEMGIAAQHARRSQY